MQCCTNELFALCARSNNTIKIHKHLEESILRLCCYWKISYSSVDMKKNRSNSTNYYPILVYTLVYSWFNVPVSDNKARKEKIVQHLLSTTSLTHSPFAAFSISQVRFFNWSLWVHPTHIMSRNWRCSIILNEKRYQKTKQGNECSPDRRSPHKCT